MKIGTDKQTARRPTSHTHILYLLTGHARTKGNNFTFHTRTPNTHTAYTLQQHAHTPYTHTHPSFATLSPTVSTASKPHTQHSSTHTSFTHTPLHAHLSHTRTHLCGPVTPVTAVHHHPSLALLCPLPPTHAHHTNTHTHPTHAHHTHTPLHAYLTHTHAPVRSGPTRHCSAPKTPHSHPHHYTHTAHTPLHAYLTHARTCAVRSHPSLQCTITEVLLLSTLSAIFVAPRKICCNDNRLHSNTKCGQSPWQHTGQR